MEGILHAADIAVRLSVVVFMVANLAAIGLEIDTKAALAPLRDLRFVAVIMLADWVVSPLLALAIVSVLPMERSYATGLLLIGLAPAAPFLPMMVRKARGDARYTAAFMLIAALGTIFFMPAGVMLLLPGLSIDSWSVARPLIVLLFIPMAAGVAVRAATPPGAASLLRIIRPIASTATVVLLVAIMVRYLRDFSGAVGSYAIAAQLLYAVGLIAGGYFLTTGMALQRRSVVSLGLCTRNLGAALAPLVVEQTHPHTIVMIALGVPITLLTTYVAAGRFEKRAAA